MLLFFIWQWSQFPISHVCLKRKAIITVQPKKKVYKGPQNDCFTYICKYRLVGTRKKLGGNNNFLDLVVAAFSQSVGEWELIRA